MQGDYSALPLLKGFGDIWIGKRSIQFPFRCDQCGKQYQHRTTLQRHTRHECGKEPQFQCPYCIRRTKQRGNLYQHIRTHHPGKDIFFTEQEGTLIDEK